MLFSYLCNANIVRGHGLPSAIIKPPDPEMLARARQLRVKQCKMHEILRELLFFFVFFTLLVLVSSGFRDSQAMNLRQSLKKLFFTEDFVKVNLNCGCTISTLEYQFQIQFKLAFIS